MRAVDFELNGVPASRMDAALRFAREFVARREGDRVALVVFGSRAVTQCPLTFDREIALALLEYVEAEMLGKRTALGEGVALAVARLPEGGAVVLISDGEDTAGEVTPLEGARAAAERGAKVYAIGMGSAGPAPVPARLPSGRMRMQMKDYALDETTLRRMAERTGGRYFRASDTATLQSVFAEIDRLEKREAPFMRAVPAGRLGRWFSLTAALSLACLMALSATALLTAPRLR
jgi:Ca-activated chloride channel family protein